MLRAAALTMLLVACGSDPDPHVLGPCVGWTDNNGNPFTGQCEAACMTKPPITQMTCDTTVQLQCSAFDFHDIRGCCIPEPSGPIRFVECQ